MEVFVAVVKHQGLTAAAAELNLSNVMVGKYIAALEAQVATELIQRTTRQIRVTEAGWLFYESAQTAINAVNEAYLQLEALHNAPKGSLKISAPMTLGSELLAPLMAQFMQRYPDIQIELQLSNHVVDLMAEGCDCVLRIGPLKDDYGLIAKKNHGLPHGNLRRSRLFGTPWQPQHASRFALAPFVGTRHLESAIQLAVCQP